MSGTELDGVLFTESLAPPGQVILGHIDVRRNRQNSNLTEVKRLMAAEAAKLGGNVVVGFRYGQRAHKWWQQVFTFKWDTESWFGEGDVIRID